MYMESNIIKCKAIQFLCFALFLLLGVTGLHAQNPKKYYTSIIQENGILYFVKPEFSMGNRDHELFFDLTYLSGNDTLTMNFSYISKQLSPISQISLISEDSRRTDATPDKIFVDSKKSTWTHRYSVKFSFDEMVSWLSEKDLPALELKLSDGMEYIKLSAKKKQWNKNRDILMKIFSIIKANEGG